MFERILLPLDGSALAEQSIPHALEIARIFNSKIMLMHVLDPESNEEHTHPADPLHWQLLKSKAENYLHTIANQLRQALSLPELEHEGNEDKRIQVILLEGKIAENIVDYSRNQGIDLVIIGTHGSGGLSRWNLNSVISKVISQVYVPLLIVRGYMVESTDAGRVRYERILIPIDCSRRAECALTVGVAFAHGVNAHLVLTSVVKAPDLPVVEPFHQELFQLREQFVSLSQQAIRFYLDEISQRIGVENETRIIEHSSVIQAILRFADEDKTDLIIICAHGQTGDYSWPFGTIARSCIEYCNKPVLIIQDLPPSQIAPTLAEQAAEKTRSRE